MLLDRSFVRLRLFLPPFVCVKERKKGLVLYSGAEQNRDRKVQLVHLSSLKIVFDIIIVLDLNTQWKQQHRKAYCLSNRTLHNP